MSTSRSVGDAVSIARKHRLLWLSLLVFLLGFPAGKAQTCLKDNGGCGPPPDLPQQCFPGIIGGPSSWQDPAEEQTWQLRRGLQSPRNTCEPPLGSYFPNWARLRKVCLLKGEVSAAVPDGGDVGVGSSVSKGSMGDDLDFVVHAFEGAVGDPQARPGEDAVEVALDHASEGAEGLEPAMVSPPEPVLQIGSCPPLTEVVPEALEGFLQIVGSDDRLVLAAELGEAPTFLRLEVPRVLQPEPARPLERGLLFAGHLPPRLPSHLVDGLVEVLDHMEPVKGQSRLRQILADGVDVDRPHVAADNLDCPATARPEPLEELLHRCHVPVLSDPEQASTKPPPWPQQKFWFPGPRRGRSHWKNFSIVATSRFSPTQTRRRRSKS